MAEITKGTLTQIVKLEDVAERLEDDLRDLKERVIPDLRNELVEVRVQLSRLTPDAGEVMFLGRRWAPLHIWLARFLAAALLWFGATMYHDLQQLKSFAAKGDRATAGDLQKRDVWILENTRGVRGRYDERIRGLESGEHLEVPDATRLELLALRRQRLLDVEHEVERELGIRRDGEP